MLFATYSPHTSRLLGTVYSTILPTITYILLYHPIVNQGCKITSQQSIPILFKKQGDKSQIILLTKYFAPLALLLGIQGIYGCQLMDA